MTVTGFSSRSCKKYLVTRKVPLMLISLGFQLSAQLVSVCCISWHPSKPYEVLPPSFCIDFCNIWTRIACHYLGVIHQYIPMAGLLLHFVEESIHHVLVYEVRGK